MLGGRGGSLWSVLYFIVPCILIKFCALHMLLANEFTGIMMGRQAQVCRLSWRVLHIVHCAYCVFCMVCFAQHFLCILNCIYCACVDMCIDAQIVCILCAFTLHALMRRLCMWKRGELWPQGDHITDIRVPSWPHWSTVELECAAIFLRCFENCW